DEWFEDQIFIRFGSVSHVATVYVNGKQVLTHKGGFLPFEEKINLYLHKSRLNRIVVKVNNELTWDMLPPGNVVRETASDG
ncbi:beta-glucuronidase, partial [Pantoea sp. SIMBA_133]